MKNNKTICCILPMKHISTRVPNKNFRDFNGKPLFTIILEKLLKCEIIDKIIIDTNSDIIKSIVENKYKNEKIIVYNRPEHLYEGSISMNKIIANVITDLNLNFDVFIQTHSTNPLLNIETINECVECFLQKINEGFDSLFTVKNIQARLFNEKYEAINHNINELLPTQDLEKIYEENSCLYIFQKNIMLKRVNRIGYKPYLFSMNDIESCDIDTETNFIVAENLYLFNILNKNNNILITGVGGDIGQSIAKKFKLHKYKVWGIDINELENQKKNYIDRFLKYDISKEENIKKIIEEIKKEDGKLNIIVNNAAYQICKPIWELTSEEWDYTYSCNVKPSFLLGKYSLDLMKNLNNSNIINIGSVHSIVTSNQISSYASSKAAIVGLTRNMAIELSKFNIRVNCISPGAIDTKMLRDGLIRNHAGKGDINNRLEKLSKSHLMGNIGTPENVADTVLYIVNNNFVNGINLVMDGGASIKLSTE
jgi:NAD(P)-dependent dehydrogenase (short-subunit alcohol dehydrogenase family)/CMP-N-acetylneuraminic acid synthetase